MKPRFLVKELYNALINVQFGSIEFCSLFDYCSVIIIITIRSGDASRSHIDIRSYIDMLG